MTGPRVLNSALADVGQEVRREALRSIGKHGDQVHLPDGTGPGTRPLGVYGDRASNYWQGLDHRSVAFQLAEQATLDTKAHSQNEGGDGTVTWWHILREEVLEAAAESDPEALRAELIQVAAVAMKWAEAIDRRARRGSTVMDGVALDPNRPEPPFPGRQTVLTDDLSLPDHHHGVWIDGGNALRSEPCQCTIGKDHTDPSPWGDDPRPPFPGRQMVDEAAHGTRTLEARRPIPDNPQA